MKVSVSIIVLIFIAAGCNGGDKCISHSETYCQDGVTYWMDSCGEFEEVLENCQCGCEPDHTGCRVCDCTCSRAGDCCDGCHSINEGMPCDDGDPGTTTDICRSGTCVGWTFDVAEPAAPAMPDSPAAPAEPAEPAGIQLKSWTCPAGWVEVEHESPPFSWCQPPPLPRLRAGAYTTPKKDGEQDGDRPVCDPANDGSYPLVGHADCRPLGDACPSGDWPEIPPEVTGNRIYVRAGSTGAGTQASPYGTISEAVVSASPGDVVVIGPGSYPESVAVDRDLTLWGKCVAESEIQAPGPHAGGDAGTVLVAGDHRVDLVNLRISGEQIGVRVSAPGAAVTLRGVWIHSATRYGVLADAGNLTLSGVLISSTRSPADGQSGIGLGVWSGAQAQIEAATVENNRVIGITALDTGTVLSLADSVVRNTQSRQADQLFGRGLEIGSGAQATGARLLVDGNRNIGAMIRDASTAVTLTDAAITDTQPRDSDRTIGVGLQAQTGAHADLTRGLLERNHNAGIVMSDANTTATLTDLVVRDTQSQEVDGVNGEGLWMLDGAHADCSRALFSGNHSSGILAQGQGTRLDLLDGAVLDTESQASDQRFGRGLEVNGRAHVTVTRGLFKNNRDAGIVGIFWETLVELEDVTVTDTRSRESTLTDGMGLGAAQGARVTVLRGRFQRNRDVGIYADGEGTQIDLTDVTVFETQSAEADRSLGRGLNVQEGAEITVLRGRFDQNREHGVFIASAGTVATLEDLIVSGTRSRESDLTYGRGLEATAGAQVTCRRALFDQNRDSGIMAGLSGTRLVLEDTTVSDTRGLESDDANGLGLQIQTGAEVTVTRGSFSGNRFEGIGVNGSTLVLDQVTVSGTVGRDSDQLGGIGLFAYNGSRVTLTGGLFENNRTVGVFVSDAGTTADLFDLTVRDTQSEQSSQDHGRGLEVQEGARAGCTRCRLERNRYAGIAAFHAGTVLELTDVSVLDTRGRSLDLSDGYGMLIHPGTETTITRGLFEGNHTLGIFVVGPDVSLTATDLIVRETRSQESDLSFGRGLEIHHAAQVTMNRAVFARNREAAIFAYHAGAYLQIEDLIVLDTQAAEADLLLGRGLVLGGRAQASITRGLFQQNRELGIALYDSASLTLDQVSIRQTLERECSLLPPQDERNCIGAAVGSGLMVYQSSTAALSGVEISDSAMAGLQIVSQGHVSGQGLTLRSNPIGVNIQDPLPDYDFFEEVSDLVMEDNAINFDTTLLTIPDLAGDLEDDQQQGWQE